jgi:hypothetical protein
VAKAAMKVDMDWLWVQSTVDKNKWSLTRIPPGELHAPHIKKSSKNSDGSYNYFVYRDGKALGAPKTFEAAQALAKSGKIDPKMAESNKRVSKYVDETPRDAVAFKKLTKDEQSDVLNAYPWAVPKKSDLEAKGVKVKGTVVRTDLLSKNEKKAADAALPMDAKIKRIKPNNPKKQGSSAWGRWEVMFGHDGLTVGEFIKNHGNPTTLKNAVKMGYVEVKGMS